jgi:hypothetical protein
MANYHVVPRGDAVNHSTHGDRCACVVEVKTISSEDSRSGFDVWHYHRRVTLEEAVMAPRVEEVA